MNQHYNPFGILFYPFILAILFAGIYFVWQENPSLVDQLSLIEKQGKKKRRDSFLVETTPISTEDTTRFDPTGFNRLQPGDARHYPVSFRVNHRFRRAKDFQSPTGEKDEEEWVSDEKALLFQSENQLRFVDHTGENSWEFELSDDTKFCDGVPALSKDFAYACTDSGNVLALYRDSGRVAWLLRSQYKFWRSPVLTNDHLILFDKGDEYHHVIALARNTGNELWKMRTLTESLNKELAFSSQFEHMVFASDDDEKSVIYGYNLKKQTKLWEIELPQAAGDSPVLYGGNVYVSGADGLLLSYRLRSGELNWEYDLKKPLNQSLTIVPQLNTGTIVDNEGYLHVIDTKLGKRKWRYNMKTNSKALELHAVRFTSKSAAKLNMSDESKGWSFWGACGENQVCAFDPFKGYMLRRFELPGPMAAAPLLIDKGQELLLSYFEGKSLKFLKFIEKTKLDLIREAAQAGEASNLDKVQIPETPADATVDNVETEN